MAQVLRPRWKGHVNVSSFQTEGRPFDPAPERGQGTARPLRVDTAVTSALWARSEVLRGGPGRAGAGPRWDAASRGPSLVSPVHGPGPRLPWRQLPPGPAPPGTPAPPAPGQGVLLGSWSLTPIPTAHGRLLWGSATPRLPGPQPATRGRVPGKMGPWLLEEGGEPTRAGQSAPDQDPGPSKGQSGCPVRRLERPARAAAAARLTRPPELRRPSFRNLLFSCFSLSPSLHSGKFILL